MFHINFRTRLLPLCAAALLIAGCGNKEEAAEVNHAPTADAGINQTFSSNAPVNLSASGSFDPDGDPMAYNWSFESVPTTSGLLDMESPFTLNGETDATTSFTPDVEGTYVVALVVTDALGLSSTPDRVIVTINSGDAPVAEAGDEQIVEAGTAVSLDGTSSFDLLGRELTYSWTFARVPGASTLTELEAADSGNAAFTPDVSGIYLIALIVNNGLEASSPDTTVVRVSAGVSDIPISVAGSDVAASDCTDIPLNGTDSYDPNGEPLTYLWDLESRPEGSAATTNSFSDRTSASPRFHADTDGTYIVSLAVHDGTAWSTPDSLSIIAEERNYNTPPATSPGAPRTIAGGEASCEEAAYSSYICGYCEASTMLLGADAFVNDPDGDKFDILWTVSDGSAAIDDPTSLNTEVVLSSATPDVPGECSETTYSFVLTATDCTGAVTSEEVTHTVSCCGVAPDVPGGDDGGGTDDPYGYYDYYDYYDWFGYYF